MTSMRVLVVDDERPARQRLSQLLAKVPDVEVIGLSSDGREAIEIIRTEHPDLVFLDVQMPEVSGIDVLRAVGPSDMPMVIFVTAYDQYALEAFELAALDYLLKPFDNERFAATLERAREQVHLRQSGHAYEKLRQFLEEVDGPHAAPNKPERVSEYLQRLAVEDRGQVRVIPVSSIHYITASGAYVELHTDATRFLLRKRIKNLANELDPSQFCRIHRSTIINLSQIDVLKPRAYGDYTVRLKDGSTLRVSRSYKKHLADQLGVSL